MSGAWFAELVQRSLVAGGVADRLTLHPAAILERLARAAGATRWYWVSGADELEDLAVRLHPGSEVSFYFDERLAWRILDDEVRAELLAILADDGDFPLGRPLAGIELDVVIVSGMDELAREVAHAEGKAVLVGRFPSRADDGQSAITIHLPDLDGVVRSHPY